MSNSLLIVVVDGPMQGIFSIRLITSLWCSNHPYMYPPQCHLITWMIMKRNLKRWWSAISTNINLTNLSPQFIKHNKIPIYDDGSPRPTLGGHIHVVVLNLLIGSQPSSLYTWIYISNTDKQTINWKFASTNKTKHYDKDKVQHTLG